MPRSSPLGPLPFAALLGLMVLGCAKDAPRPEAVTAPSAPPVSVGLSAPAQPAPTGEQAVAATEAENTLEQTILFSPIVACTRMMCPNNSCCNSCTFLKWSKGRVEAEAAPGAEPLPSCTPDGCGACPSQLSATGRMSDGKLIVSQWALVAPTAEAPAP